MIEQAYVLDMKEAHLCVLVAARPCSVDVHSGCFAFYGLYCTLIIDFKFRS